MADGRTQQSTARQVEQLISELDVGAASRQAVAELASRICALGRPAVVHLARSILRPGPGRREKVAALLGSLTGYPAVWAREELRRILGKRRLTAMERVWLTATARSLESLSASGEAVAPHDGRPREDASRPPPPEPDETELAFWRDELTGLEPEERVAAMGPVLESGEAAFLPLVEMALSLADPQLDAAIAAGLARFRTPAALPLLRELLRRPQAAVRRQARRSLLALERQGVDARGVFVAASAADEPPLAALATPLDGAGQMGVVVARRGQGLIHYAFVLLDTLEAGIARAWGERDLTEADLLERITHYSNQSGLHFDPIDLATAQALVAAAEAFTRAEGHQLPSEYLAWRRMIGRPRGSPRLPVAFGPACAQCGRRVRQADIDGGGLVAGPVALCAACGEQQRACQSCGRELRHPFDRFYVRRTQEGEVQFLCLRCAGREDGQTN